MVCKSNQTPCKGRGPSVSGSLLTLNPGGAAVYVFLFLLCVLQMFLAGLLIRGTSRSSQRREEGEVGLGLRLNDDFHLCSEGKCKQRMEDGGRAGCNLCPYTLAPLSRQKHGWAELATIIRSAMHGAWLCVEVTGLKCPFPPHQNNF